MKQGSSTSIRTILLNLSKKENLSFQQVVTRYLHERLLYRVSLSEYKSRFVLKGGNLMYAIEGLHIRPTMDIDMLAKNIDNDKENVKNIFKKICEINYENDCVHFDSNSIIVSDIAKEKKYSGVRLLIDTQFDTVRQTTQIDIGFGDIITPAAISLTYPVLLNELESPDILAYSTETVIAEKFEAMIQLGELNSRMKDFYDVYTLLKNNRIDNDVLSEAISHTFERRKTLIKSNPEIFSKEFYLYKQRQTAWTFFLKKIKHPNDLSFETVMNLIVFRLHPIYETFKNN
jgi:predicted nucleotidyltransferase component of viral defense system